MAGFSDIALEQRQDQPKEYPVLWWTTWFGDTIEEGRIINNCGLPYTCRFTLDRTKYDDSKVIIAHAPTFKFDFPHVDDVKSGKKAFVLNTGESPHNFQLKSKWTSIFTHLWSYRFDADFVQSYFITGRDRATLIESILTKPMYTIQEKNTFRKELAPIAWIVSSCKAKNGRHLYVNQLLKYIKVDVYGHCMNNKAWPTHPDGREFTDLEVTGRYKFYLSLENSNCNDYVTEKIERPYIAGVVPILDGPDDYSRFLATNHSSIRLDDFATPKQLARRIQQLDQDDRAYMRYLDYKESSTPVESLLSPKLLETWDISKTTWGPDGNGARCHVCKFAHDMAEGNYQYDPNKVIGPDQTCTFRKWVFFSWAVEFHWWTIVLVILGIFAGAAVLIACRKSRRARRYFLELKYNLTPSSWRDKNMADVNLKKEEYQLLES
ncbi:hypothetical protein EC991_008793 [Linnemannia zychae]|nr:hypothetical protein EC991_008793 [Linnemannia zychae]